MVSPDYYELVFRGEAVAHKNEKMPVRRKNGKLSLITKPRAKEAMNRLALQIPGHLRDLKLVHPRVEVWFWVARDTFDCSNGWCAIEDLLWQYGVIVDDCVKYFNGGIHFHPAVLCDEWKTVVRLYPV